MYIILRCFAAAAVVFPLLSDARTLLDVSDDNDRALVLECQDGYTKCMTVAKCVHDTFWCDGDNDCGDSSDENTAFCRKRTCKDDQVKCQNGQCIEIEDFCSEQTSCHDGSVRRNRFICPDAPPSFDMCLDVVMETCAMPISDEWIGLESGQLRQKIINTNMSEICKTVKQAKLCADQTLELGCDEGDAALMPDYYRRFRTDYSTFIDIICVQEIYEINRYKGCILGKNKLNADIFDMVDQCMTKAESHERGCWSDEFQACLVLEIWRTCGEAIAGVAHRHRVQLVRLLTDYLIEACIQLGPQRRGLIGNYVLKRSN